MNVMAASVTAMNTISAAKRDQVGTAGLDGEAVPVAASRRTGRRASFAEVTANRPPRILHGVFVAQI